MIEFCSFVFFRYTKTACLSIVRMENWFDIYWEGKNLLFDQISKSEHQICSQERKRTLQCLHCVQINIDELKLKYLIGPIGITLRNGMTTDKATVYFCYFNWNNDDFLRKSWISFAKTKTNTEKNSSYRFSHFASWIYLLDEKRSEEYEKLQLP